jgi:GH24 family phage-related lysozyme (muramidase)
VTTSGLMSLAFQIGPNNFSYKEIKKIKKRKKKKKKKKGTAPQ